jgi:hypothetical protein
MQVLPLPDGYNGHTETFHAEPIDSDAACIKLRCASPGKEYMIRWVSRDEYEKLMSKTAQRPLGECHD